MLTINIPNINSRYKVFYNAKESTISFLLSGSTYHTEKHRILRKDLYQNMQKFTGKGSIRTINVTPKGLVSINLSEWKARNILPRQLKDESNKNIFETILKDIEDIDIGYIPAIDGFKQELIAYIEFMKEQNKYLHIEFEIAKFWKDDNILMSLTINIDKEVAKIKKQNVIVINEKQPEENLKRKLEPSSTIEELNFTLKSYVIEKLFKTALQ